MVLLHFLGDLHEYLVWLLYPHCLAATVSKGPPVASFLSLSHSWPHSVMPRRLHTLCLYVIVIFSFSVCVDLGVLVLTAFLNMWSSAFASYSENTRQADWVVCCRVGNSVCCWAWLAQPLQRAHDLLDLEFASERHCISSVNSQAFTWGVTPLAVLATVPLFPLSLKCHLLSLGLESTCKGLLQVPAFSAPPPFSAQHLALPFRVT